MTPCAQQERIASLEKKQENQTRLLHEIRDLVERTNLAITGDPRVGLTGLVDRVDGLERVLKTYEEKRWFANGAVWMAGAVSGIVVWLADKLWTSS